MVAGADERFCSWGGEAFICWKWGYHCRIVVHAVRVCALLRADSRRCNSVRPGPTHHLASNLALLGQNHGYLRYASKVARLPSTVWRVARHAVYVILWSVAGVSGIGSSYFCCGSSMLSKVHDISMDFVVASGTVQVHAIVRNTGDEYDLV